MVKGEIQMKKVKFILVLCLLASLAMAPYAFAGDVKTTLGLGVGWMPDYEGSNDYEAVPIPYAKVTWGDGAYLLLNGASLRVNLLNKTFQLGPILQYRRERGNVDDKRIKRMDKIDGATEAGAFIAYRFDSLLLGVDAVTDISNEHDGYLITLRGAYTFDFCDGSNIVPFISTTYADDDYMETYFQVDPGNVGSSNLPYYEAEACFKDVKVGVNSDMAVSDNWILRATAVYTKLLDDAKDSPVVDDVGDDNQFFVGLVCAYKF